MSQRGAVSRSRAPIPQQVKPQKTDKTRLRREHTLWWVSGIVLGAAILTLFAVLEKRRNDVLHLLEEINDWD